MTLTDGTELAFEYNADGLRTSKTVGNSIVQYVWNDGNLVAEIRDGYTLKFLYNNGEAAGFSYNGADYYYGKDSFGVIRYLYNTSGEVVTTYTYDAWGTVLSVTGTLAETVGTVNPVRYKSYYLDSETGWYYLQSRYYDSEVGRFLNADETQYLGFVKSSLAFNLFAYCMNNPVTRDDPSGFVNFWKLAKGIYHLTIGIIALVSLLKKGALLGALGAASAKLVQIIVASILGLLPLGQYWGVIICATMLILIAWRVITVVSNIPKGLNEIKQALK